MLPTDPTILLSYVNLKLRDSYSSFGEMCDREDLDGEEIEGILKLAGFAYNPDTNQFR